MQKTKWFVTFKKNLQAKIRLITFHHSGGAASTYFPWVKDLSSSIELMAIQLPGREGRFDEPLINQIEEITYNLSQEFLHYTDKPFFIFGHSLGALLGFEFAKSIQETYTTVPQHIIVSATKAPHLPLRRKELSQLDTPNLKAELSSYGGVANEIVNDEELFNLFSPILRSDFSIYENYRYIETQPLLCNMLALSGAADHSVQEGEILAWSQHIKGHFKHISFSGDHFFLKRHQKKIIQIINYIGENYTRQNRG